MRLQYGINRLLAGHRHGFVHDIRLTVAVLALVGDALNRHGATLLYLQASCYSHRSHIARVRYLEIATTLGLVIGLSILYIANNYQVVNQINQSVLYLCIGSIGQLLTYGMVGQVILESIRLHSL